MSILKSTFREGALFPPKKYQQSIVQIKNVSVAKQEATLDRPRCFGHKVVRSGSEDLLAVRPRDAR